MRKFNSTAFILFFLCVTFDEALAQGTAFTYQGRLGENGTTANGSYDFRFMLFDAASSGTQIGLPLTNGAVVVSSGFFTVSLDFGAGAFPGANRWLQIGVRTNGSGGAFITLNPRQPVTRTPYALTAGDVTGANIARLNPPNTAVQAAGTPVITSGFITSANVVNGGSGYVTPPLVTVNDATGSGAIILANISGGSVASFTVQNPGSGYSAGATLMVAPPPSNASQTFSGVNYFGGANFLTNGGNVVAGNGSGLNSLNAANLSSGTVAETRLSSNVALLNRTQTFTGTNNFADPANSFTGNGAGLTELNAASLTGTVADSRLSANVARLNANQTFTGSVNFSNTANAFAGMFVGNGAAVSNVPLAQIDSSGAVTANGPFAFAAISTLNVGASPKALVAVDVNGDGKIDLVSANSSPNSISVFTNNGFGTFILASAPPVGFSPVAITTADVNGDGRVDVVTANLGGSTLSVMTNVGGGVFGLSSSPVGGSEPIGVTAADVNGDGHVDLIGVSRFDNFVIVSTNNGLGGFSISHMLTVSSGPQAVAAGDVNGDGRVDLVVGTSSSTVVVLTNNGSGGRFTPAFTNSVGFGEVAVGMATADVNGDGRIDFITANSGARLAVFINNGNGTLTRTSNPTVGNGARSVAAVDVNGDGRIDLISGNRDADTVSVLTNDGSGSFSLMLTRAVGDEPLGVAAADLNGDGRIDLVSANSTAKTLSLIVQVPFNFVGNFAGNFYGTDGFFSGRVGIGTTLPNHRLRISGGPAWTANGWGGAIELDNASAIAWNANPAGNRFGIGQSTGGFYIFATASDPGNTVNPPVYVMTISDSGNVGIGIGTGTPSTYLQVINATCNGTTWNNASDRALKENFARVNGREVLEKVIGLPIQSWNYKRDANSQHIGPVAQDFHAAFSLNGEDDKHISTIDADGVALAAIQGLNEKLEEEMKRNRAKDAEILELKQRLADFEKLLRRSVITKE